MGRSRRNRPTSCGAIRQGKLWRHLLDQLSPDQLEQIEFVFTYTPRELAALDRGERPSA
jgi:hypothetical protein